MPGEGQPQGTSPLDEDEAEGLIPDLHTRADLNAWELGNILKAEEWAFGGRRGDILTIDFAKELHRRMLDETWTWAGEFRRSDKSIGVYWATITDALGYLLDDTRYWISNGTYPADEVLARFHHRLVSIHPFPNGNGRHARLMADVLASAMGWEPLTWGRGNLGISGQARTRYLAALKQADNGHIVPLVDFIRS
ncbi:MAG: mobile mystery protein B [bacterium]